MKVMCINNKPLPDRKHNKCLTELKEGEVYNVVKEIITDEDFPPVYKLVETVHWYCITRFIPIDGPDEMDILAERSISDDKVREMIQNAIKTK